MNHFANLALRNQAHRLHPSQQPSLEQQQPFSPPQLLAPQPQPIQPMQLPNAQQLMAITSPPVSGLYPIAHPPRQITIFDVFPGIVEYQSKKFSERDRVEYLLALSEKPLLVATNPQLQVDQLEMWYAALKYLLNAQFELDRMPMEVRYVLKKFMQTHQNRVMFLERVKLSSFSHVIRNISKEVPKKLPKLTKNIAKVVKAEQEAKAQLQIAQQVQLLPQTPMSMPSDSIGSICSIGTMYTAPPSVPMYYGAYPMNLNGYGQAHAMDSNHSDTMFAGWS
mmetsp:Transcript_12508/g.18898  ORF Transcript_12508/g.18898 Transcript_12508/m.18898 type:complete len:279 (-) Transcript_12508:148-984(-)